MPGCPAARWRTEGLYLGLPGFGDCVEACTFISINEVALLRWTLSCMQAGLCAACPRYCHDPKRPGGSGLWFSRGPAVRKICPMAAWLRTRESCPQGHEMVDGGD